jgi:uncharacterized Ntn-hydrolase superfamily protein
MDFSRRAAAWVTAFVMTHPAIKDAANKLDKYVDPDTAKLTIQVALIAVPEIIGDENHGIAAIIEAVNPVLDKMADDAIDAALGVGHTVEETSPEDQAIAEAIREDAVKAAEAIEEYTVELEIEQSEEPDLVQEETSLLEKEFAEERKELTDKLDELEELYFENHPDVDDTQRAGAEERFDDIRKEEIAALETRQEDRSAELELFQQQREVEDTRDERC